jgi:esterase/lipase
MPDSPLSGKDVYNAIMAKIEPDLVENVLPTLDKKYAGESEEEHKARMARYDKAFAEYDKQFAAFMTKLQEEVHGIQKNARVIAEQKSTAEEAKLQEELLSQISAL